MTPEEINSGVAFSAQLIGLLSVWKSERKAVKDDAFQDFSIWLANHNFNAISERIFESEEIQRDLHGLLAGSLENIDSKIDRLEQLLVGVASKLEGFRTIDRAVSAETETLSTQAREILKLFAERGEPKMVVCELGVDRFLIFLPSTEQFKMDDDQFLFDDVNDLEAAGFIRHHDTTNDGDAIYLLTRPGKELADRFPSVEIRKPGDEQ